MRNNQMDFRIPNQLFRWIFRLMLLSMLVISINGDGLMKMDDGSALNRVRDYASPDDDAFLEVVDQFTTAEFTTRSFHLLELIQSGKVTTESALASMFNLGGGIDMKKMVDGGIVMLEDELMKVAIGFSRECENGCGGGIGFNESLMAVRRVEQFNNLEGKTPMLLKLGKFSEEVEKIKKANDKVKQLSTELSELNTYPKNNSAANDDFISDIRKNARDTKDAMKGSKDLAVEADSIKKDVAENEIGILERVQTDSVNLASDETKIDGLEVVVNEMNSQSKQLKNILPEMKSSEMKLALVEKFVTEGQNTFAVGEIAPGFSYQMLDNLPDNLQNFDFFGGPEVERIIKIHLKLVFILRRILTKWINIRKQIVIPRDLAQNLPELALEFKNTVTQMESLPNSDVTVKHCTDQFHLSPFSDNYLPNAKSDISQIDSKISQVKSTITKVPLKDPEVKNIGKLIEMIANNSTEEIKNLKNSPVLEDMKKDVGEIEKMINGLSLNNDASGVAHRFSGWYSSTNIMPAFECLTVPLQSAEQLDTKLRQLEVVKMEEFRDVISLINSLKEPIANWGKPIQKLKVISKSGKFKKLDKKILVTLSSAGPTIRSLVVAQILQVHLKKVIENFGTIDSAISNTQNPKKKQILQSMWTQNTKKCLVKTNEMAGKVKKTVGQKKKLDSSDLTNILELIKNLPNCQVDSELLFSELSVIVSDPDLKTSLVQLEPLRLQFTSFETTSLSQLNDFSSQFASEKVLVGQSETVSEDGNQKETSIWSSLSWILLCVFFIAVFLYLVVYVIKNGWRNTVASVISNCCSCKKNKEIDVEKVKLIDGKSTESKSKSGETGPSRSTESTAADGKTGTPKSAENGENKNKKKDEKTGKPKSEEKEGNDEKKGGENNHNKVLSEERKKELRMLARFESHKRKVRKRHYEDTRSDKFHHRGNIFIPADPVIVSPPKDEKFEDIPLKRVKYCPEDNEQWDIGTEVDDIELLPNLTEEPGQTITEEESTAASAKNPKEPKKTGSGKGGKKSAEGPPKSGKGGPTSGKGGPTSGKIGPTSGEGGPTSGKIGPTSGEGGPTSGKIGPTSGEGGPTSGKIGPESGLKR